MNNTGILNQIMGGVIVLLAYVIVILGIWNVLGLINDYLLKRALIYLKLYKRFVDFILDTSRRNARAKLLKKLRSTENHINRNPNE